MRVSGAAGDRSRRLADVRAYRCPRVVASLVSAYAESAGRWLRESRFIGEVSAAVSMRHTRSGACGTHQRLMFYDALRTSLDAPTPRSTGQHGLGLPPRGSAGRCRWWSGMFGEGLRAVAGKQAARGPSGFYGVLIVLLRRAVRGRRVEGVRWVIRPCATAVPCRRSRLRRRVRRLRSAVPGSG
jgi:hypothetical protein